MKSKIVLLILLGYFRGYCQVKNDFIPSANARLSILLFPFTPLFTLEVKVWEKFSIQFESNFINTHGLNLKYFSLRSFEKDYFFSGIAFVENTQLRKDKKITYIPYLGYGYAYRFGKMKKWNLDSRIGIGFSNNADHNTVYPIIKTGIGRLF